MAINISDKYPGRSNPPSVDYPQGSIKNQTAPGARDGTPLDEAWANDKEGFFQSLLTARGITANGEVDKVGGSQYYDALAANPTETLRGLPLVATQAEINAGTDDAKVVTSKKLRAGFAYNFGASAGYIFLPSWLMGFGIQWGQAEGADKTPISFPIAFPVGCFAVFLTDRTGASTGPAGVLPMGVGRESVTKNGFEMRLGGSSVTDGGYFFAIGH